MSAISNHLVVTFKWALRDRLLHGVIGSAFLLLLLVPVFSVFSMRQVQELSITLSLSAISAIMLVLTLLLSASSVWRDVERRYTSSVLTLPGSRTSYILGKFLGISLFLLLCAILLGAASSLVIIISSLRYPSDVPIHWQNIMLSIMADSLKCILLAAVGVMFSTISTSFFLPFFASLSIYFAGSASQEVFEYVNSELGKTISLPVKLLIKWVYYVVPNLSAFNFKVQAIYGLPVLSSGVFYTAAYFLIYTCILLYVSAWFFSRRELP